MQSSASSTGQSASERVSEPFTRDSTLPLNPSGDLESHDTSETFFCSLAGCHSSEPLARLLAIVLSGHRLPLD